MSMTREEAIKVLKNGGIEVCGEADRISEFIAALDVALDALIPPTRENELEAENIELKERIVNWRNYMAPTRERVEKVWRGYWIHEEIRSNQSTTGYFKISSCECSKCGCYIQQEANFCPYCGAPMTDEAVEMVMERLEALHSETKTD